MRNVSFVQEESQGSLGSGSSNTSNSVPEQIGGGNSQQSPPLATTTSNASASSATAATADSSGAGATSSSSSFSTAAPACASSSQPSAAPAAAEENSTNAAEQRNMGSSEGSSSGQDGERALEEDLEERINSLNTDRLRDLLEAMERLQETFAASQEVCPNAPRLFIFCLHQIGLSVVFLSQSCQIAMIELSKNKSWLAINCQIGFLSDFATFMLQKSCGLEVLIIVAKKARVRKGQSVEEVGAIGRERASV